MSHQNKSHTRTIQLGQEAHQLAQTFRQHQSNFHNAQQVYLNTLAVYAVNGYLKQEGIETNLEASDSWDSVMQSLVDIADLKIKQWGQWQKLECRPVFSDTQVVYIPAEVWQDRIGYVAVRLNEFMTEATVLGFVKTTATETLPISQLKPLEDLLKYLKPEPLVNLSQWLENIFDAGWQTVEEILGSPDMSLAFRGVKSVAVKRAKLIQLGNSSVALILDLTQSTDPEPLIKVQVRSVENNNSLPDGLTLKIIDEAEQPCLDAVARRGDYLIQTQFSGQKKEQFTVNVSLGEESVVEKFII